MSLPSVTGVDHYIVRANQLEAATRDYVRLGFALAPQGRHHKGTRNQTIILDANYLELLYFPEELKADSRFNRFDDEYEGAVAVALQTGDSFAVHSELTALGFSPDEPIVGGRPVVLPKGTFDAAWANTEFPAEAATLPLFFTCGHRTRDLVYREEWQLHPNGARRIESLVVVHPNPAQLAGEYTRLFGKLSVSQQSDVLEIRRGTLTLQILAPSIFQKRFPGITVPAGHEQGWFAGSSIGVRNLEHTKRQLTSNGVPFVIADNGAVVPPLTATAGALLAFEQEK